MSWRNPSNGLFRIYNRVTNSIAFHPAWLATLFFSLGILMIYVEYAPWTLPLKDRIELLLVSNRENARTILGTLVGSTISLTVFSFSMVMVVLNRASATLSPRIIPGLVTQRRHQQILGFYVGTIVYALVLMLNIGSSDQPKTPSLGILLCIVFGVICLGLFVYFIHSISRAIQVDAIIQSIFDRTLKLVRLRNAKLRSSATGQSWPNDAGWQEIKALKPGYFKRLNAASLTGFLARHEAVATLQVRRGEFVTTGQPLLRVSRQLQENACDQLRQGLLFYIEEYVEEHYSFGMKQLSEVAIKAMSPGINDPGTAAKCLDLLCAIQLQLDPPPGLDLECDREGTPRIFYPEWDTRQLLQKIWAPIRTYSQGDPLVMCNYLHALYQILAAAKDERERDVITDHLRSAVASIDQNVSNRLDRQVLNGCVRQINGLLNQSSRIDELL